MRKMYNEGWKNPPLGQNKKSLLLTLKTCLDSCVMFWEHKKIKDLEQDLEMLSNFLRFERFYILFLCVLMLNVIWF